MITKHYEHKGLHVHIVIDGHLIVLSSRFATLRLRLAAPSDDDGALKWLRSSSDIGHRHIYMLQRAEPEIKNVFNDDAWGAFCEKNGIDSGVSYEARDTAKEGGHRPWRDYLEGELAEAKMQVVEAREGEFWGLPQDEVNLVNAAVAFALGYVAPAPLDIERVANAAWMAQDASNLSGLVRSWAEWMPAINAHAQAQGVAQNAHAVNVIMAEKVGQLAGLTITAGSDGAYAVVAELAKRP